VSTQIIIKQQGAGVSNQGGNVVARIGPCSAGPTLQVLAFDPGQDVAATCGFGAVCESTKRSLTVAQRRALIVATENTENGTIGAVTETPAGPGPTIGVALNDDDFGPFDNYRLAVRVDVGGALGLARVAVALDGASYGYGFDVPLEAPAQAIGTVDLKNIDLSTLNGLTVVAHNETDTTNRTTTFVTPADPAAVVTQLQTVFTANGSHMVASLVAGRYLKIASAIGGASSHLTIVSGTALATLGLTAATYDGSPATIQLEGTNLVLTFPSGTYVKDTVYTCTCTGPTMALADALAAMDVLKADALNNPFAKIEITQPAADGHDLRTWVDQINAKLLSWQSGDFKVFVRAAINGPLGATGPTGIAANDLDVKTAMIGCKNITVDVAHGDAYMVGQDIIGSFRRGAVEALTMQYAAHSLSEDPGNAAFGALEMTSLASPDYDQKAGTGVLARDENLAVTKMGTSSGPGFTVLKNKPEGVFFVRGVTRAGSASLFVDIGVISMAYYAAAIVDQLLRSVENTTVDLDADGFMLEHDRHALEQNWTATLESFTVGQGHASAARVTIAQDVLVSGPFARTLRATFDVQERGQLEHVIGTLSIDGTLSLAAA